MRPTLPGRPRVVVSTAYREPPMWKETVRESARADGALQGRQKSPVAPHGFVLENPPVDRSFPAASIGQDGPRPETIRLVERPIQILPFAVSCQQRDHPLFASRVWERAERF